MATDTPHGPPTRSRAWGAAAFALLAVAIVSALSLGIGATMNPPSDFETRFRRIAAGAGSEKVGALTVGHSRGVSIDFEAMGLRGRHLWIGSGDMFENDAILAALLPQQQDLEVVFLAVDPLSFGHDNGGASAFSPTRVAVYGAVGPTFMIGWDLENWIRARLRNLARSGGVAKTFWCGPIADCATLARRPQDPFATAESRVSKVVGMRATRNAQAAAALRRLGARLDARKIVLVLHAPPVSNVYAAALAKALPLDNEEKRLEGILRGIAQDHPCVVFAKPRLHPAFTADPKMFSDPDHLSKKGAMVYSRSLAASVESARKRCLHRA